LADFYAVLLFSRRLDDEMTAVIQTRAENEPAMPRVLVAMGFAVVALSFSSIFIKKLDAESVPPLVIAFYRMAMATALLMPGTIALRRRELAALSRGDVALLLLGGFCLAVHFGAWITSLRYIPIATSVVLVNSHPLFVVIASYLFLGERPDERMVWGTTAGLVGIAIIGKDGFSDAGVVLLGDGLALLGALAVVGYFIVGRKVRARVSLLGYATPLYAVCSLLLLSLLLTRGDKLYPYSPIAWGYFVALAVVPTILGHTVFNWALKHVPPSAVSVTFLGEPLMASLLALFFFDQRPPVATLVGGALVLAGIYLTTSAKRRQ
jgi:drug/metabolite transporter (DMT)-like permease